MTHITLNQPITFRQTSGFTLIEIILYVAIISLLLTTLTGFVWNMISIQSKSGRIAEMTHTMATATYRLAQDIREATAFSIANNTLTLTLPDSSRNPTVYSVINGRLHVGMSTAGSCPTSNPCPLTPSWFTVATPIFASSNTPTNRHVRVTLSATAAGGRKEWQVSQFSTVSVQLRTP